MLPYIAYAISSLFNISVITVKEELSSLIELFHVNCYQFVSWPIIKEWRQILNVWQKLPSAVCAIDGTSFEIYRLNTDRAKETLFFGL